MTAYKFAGKVTVLSAVFANARKPIDSVEAGKLMPDNDLQLKNAKSPMLLTLGIDNEEREVHSANADLPMYLTLSPREAEVIDVEANAWSPIHSIQYTTVTERILVLPSNAPLPISVILYPL